MGIYNVPYISDITSSRWLHWVCNCFSKKALLGNLFFIIYNSRLFTQHMLQLQILKLRKVYNNITDWTKIT